MTRVRFAPSPTGYLHIGSVRTALYNYIYAKQNKGSFILRIEDTDRSRSTEEAVKNIIEGLKWLGLNWDEGPDANGQYCPYRQTERLELYREACETLLLSGDAYLCYCLPEELKARREEAIKKGLAPGYDRLCRDLTLEEQNECRRKNKHPVYRFRAPLSGETKVNDIIRGQIVFQNENLDDFILLRSDGTPTYNLAAVVDDSTMDITHVIRGDDHLPNTPKQIALYQALGYTKPKFAHLPMIVGPDKKRLSKRHGATSIEEFKEGGYLPEALLNYTALLGWGYDEKTTFFSVPELIEKFKLERVSKNPAVWDIKKLNWMNGSYIRKMTDEELAKKITSLLINKGLLKQPEEQKKKLFSLVQITKERINTLTDILPLVRFFFKKIKLDNKAKDLLVKDEAKKALEQSLSRLSRLEGWNRYAIETELRLVPEEAGIKAKTVFQSIRAAISGSLISPPLFESLEILGKKESIKRIDEALEE